MRNNELQLDLAKFSLLKSNNTDIARKNKYLKDDNITLRDQIREKEREVKSLKTAFNEIVDQNTQYHDQYGSPNSASFRPNQEMIGDNQSIKRTNEFVMRLLQQLYSAVGSKFTQENRTEEELASKRLSDYVNEIKSNDRMMTKGLSAEHQGIIKSDHDVVIRGLRTSTGAPINTVSNHLGNKYSSPH